MSNQLLLPLVLCTYRSHWVHPSALHPARPNRKQRYWCRECCREQMREYRLKMKFRKAGVRMVA